MKQKTDLRIENAKSTTKEELVSKIKDSNQTLFDQMLIETEERKLYYYVKYKSTAFKRKAFQITFPIYKEIQKDFDQNFLSIEENYEPKKVANSHLIDDLLNRGITPDENEAYNNKNLCFSDLPLDVEGLSPLLNQPFFFIRSETEKYTCPDCNGEKYVTCPDEECQGQHIYDCDECNATGKIDCQACNHSGMISCKNCSGRGEYTCRNCGGRGDKKCNTCDGTGDMKNSGRALAAGTCSKCHGSGIERCTKCRDGIVRCEKCAGKGENRCDNCSGRGEITCHKCSGKRQITCQTCYGDHKDGRYGKIDCATCETMGELGKISYIRTKVKEYSEDFIFTEGREISAPNFDLNMLKTFVIKNPNPILTYLNLNKKNESNYDNHSEKVSLEGLLRASFYKNKYPNLIKEEIYYEGIPCATYTYNHILSATIHEVSILSIDIEKTILFHSNPTAIEEKEKIIDQAKELISRAFSTKNFKDKLDRKHEMFLMIHMAKADGVIEDQEKRYLAKTITSLKGFTNKERAEIFGLMSSKELPPIAPNNSYFSSIERADQAKNRIIELIAKADGEYEQIEKLKIEEINNAIELGFKTKPSWIGRFIKTWQVSLSIMILLILISFSTYFAIFQLPVLRAEYKHNDLLKIEKDLIISISDSTIINKEAEIESIKHLSNLIFMSDSGEISYSIYWLKKHDYFKKEFDNAVQFEILKKEADKNAQSITPNENNTIIQNIDSTTLQQDSINNNDSEIKNEAEQYLGEYIGKFGDAEIIISFENYFNGSVKAFNTFKNKKTEMIGTFRRCADEEPTYIHAFELKEPNGTQNGVFIIQFGTNRIDGTWESYDGKIKREFELNAISN